MQNLKNQFLINPNITYLNFGSFGACPKPIFEEYQKLQLELEKEPVEFITKTGLKLLQQAKKSLGDYIHCDEEDLIFVTNPSYAVNIIAKSFNLNPGDEVLATNIEYGACDKTWEYYCEKKGAKYIRTNITFPITSKDDFVQEFVKGFTNKTKLIFISHITSSTGLRLPVEEICQWANEKGVLVFVDGAHAPGQIPLNIKELGASIYTGACHKWMMTPKGCSFLYVQKNIQDLFDPLIISWGYKALFPSNSKFQDYHQMQGTRDYSAFLTIPKSIEFMKAHNWWEVAIQCRKMVQSNAPRFIELLGTKSLCKINDDFLVQLFSIPIKHKHPEKLHDQLYSDFKIEIPVMRQNDKVFIRYSIQAFNTQKDLDILYSALTELKKDLI
ncbi:MAG: aminotransferase class V-fold PLP-dependent enzyme [Sphingobacteriaceae bacterium]|nr:aminotransferase class V-fold PLP-dependent enzyme [Sphingobacteriaceae bacterium]